MMAAPGVIAVVVERSLCIVFYQLFAYTVHLPSSLSLSLESLSLVLPKRVLKTTCGAANNEKIHLIKSVAKYFNANFVVLFSHI